MQQEVSQTNHMCILLRISNYYMGLTVLQLALTATFLLAMHKSMIQIASLIQIWLALLIMFDLIIKFLSEKTKFWSNKWNIVDIGIFFIVIFSIVIAYTHTDAIEHTRNNTLGAILMGIRYIVQTYRLVLLVKTAKQIHEQKKYQGMINLKIGIGIDVDNENGDNVDNPNFNTQ